MQRRKIDRWRVGVSLLFALVLCLGMFGIAVADPPDPHPACEKEDPPPGCEDDDHPGNGDGDEDDEGEDPGGDANPLAPLGEACSQVVQAIAENDPSGQAIQLHALCEALGAEPLEDEGDGEEPPPGEEEPPTQPFADGCNAFIDQLVDNGAPGDVEQGRQLCDQFGESPDDGGGEEPPNEEPPSDEDPTAALGEGCSQVVGPIIDNDPTGQAGQLHAACEQLGAEPEDGEGGEEEPPSDDGGGPLAPVKDGCDQVVDALGGLSPEFEQGRQVCDAMS